VTTPVHAIRHTTVSVDRVAFFAVSTSLELPLSHPLPAVRNLKLLIALGPLVVRHGILTGGADLLSIHNRPFLAAANRALHALVVLVHEVTFSASLTVVVRVGSPRSAVCVVDRGRASRPVGVTR
jgi:hypothetical protein